ASYLCQLEFDGRYGRSRKFPTRPIADWLLHNAHHLRAVQVGDFDHRIVSDFEDAPALNTTPFDLKTRFDCARALRVDDVQIDCIAASAGDNIQSVRRPFHLNGMAADVMAI